eukprot:341969-Chlamydomonas_euryale.AAC.5
MPPEGVCKATTTTTTHTHVRGSLFLPPPDFPQSVPRAHAPGRTSASLKSNESERSAKPMPRNAWLPDAASSTRTTKLRDESTDGSMYCRRVPYGTGHSANSSPDAVSTKRTWHVSPRATMRSWPTKTAAARVVWRRKGGEDFTVCEATASPRVCPGVRAKHCAIRSGA